MTALAILVCLPAVFALAMTVFNLVMWPRGNAGRAMPDVAVLIPARDEERGIERAVQSALRSGATQVAVYDDGSTDATPRILEDLAAGADNLTIVAGGELPPGWVGKPHACHRLAQHTRADTLLFMDADVELADGALERMQSLFDRFDADAVTVVPRQVLGSTFERLVMPLLHVTYTSWLPLPLIWRSRDPRFLAANGQVLAVRRAVYEATGGFEAVRDAVVDDMALCRKLKQTGHRVVFGDGHRIASCRMYAGASEVWRGFSKNIYEGLGSSVALLGAIALYLWAFVAPWAALALAFFWPSVLPAAIVGVAANIAQRILHAVRHEQPLWGAVTHPLAVLVLVGVALNSWFWHARSRIDWKGRSYSRIEERRT